METMLDAHPLIWGMGEDSVFNGNLTYLRDAMVQVNTDENSQKRLESVLLDFGQSTVQGMKKMVRQTVGEQAKGKTKNANKDWKKMRHIVDKMLFNYRNIGELCFCFCFHVCVFLYVCVCARLSLCL